MFVAVEFQGFIQGKAPLWVPRIGGVGTRPEGDGDRKDPLGRLPPGVLNALSEKEGGFWGDIRGFGNTGTVYPKWETSRSRSRFRIPWRGIFGGIGVMTAGGRWVVADAVNEWRNAVDEGIVAED
jgi:hypothetical protein